MYDRNTKVGEILHLKGLPALIEKYTGQRIGYPLLRKGAGLTLQRVASYLMWPEEKLNRVIGELNRLNETEKGET